MESGDGAAEPGPDDAADPALPGPGVRKLVLEFDADPLESGPFKRTVIVALRSVSSGKTFSVIISVSGVKGAPGFGGEVIWWPKKIVLDDAVFEDEAAAPAVYFSVKADMDILPLAPTDAVISVRPAPLEDTPAWGGRKLLRFVVSRVEGDPSFHAPHRISFQVIDHARLNAKRADRQITIPVY